MSKLHDNAVARHARVCALRALVDLGFLQRSCGGQYFSITATNTSQLVSLRMLNLSLKYSHVVSCMQYSSYKGLIGSNGGDSMLLLYIKKLDASRMFMQHFMIEK